MNLLLIDTSGKKLQVAISHGKELLIKFVSKKELSHSSDIIVFIQKALKKARLNLDDINGFSLVIGPGSFTGLRIGVVLIKGLSYVTKKKVVAVTSLDVLAENIKDFKGGIIPIIDAKKGQVYSAIYKIKDSAILRKSPYLLIPINDLLRKIKGPAVFLGDAVFIYKETIKRLKPDAQFLGENLFYPKIENVAKFAYKKFKNKEFEDIFKLEPLYLYHKFCSVRGMKSAQKRRV